MKFLRLKNPNYSPNLNNAKYHLIIIVEVNGVENYASYTDIQKNGLGTEALQLSPVSKHVTVPRNFLLTPYTFHNTRRYLESFSVSAAEEVTEEQIKTEEAIDINSGFEWLHHERKLQQSKSTDSYNNQAQLQTAIVQAMVSASNSAVDSELARMLATGTVRNAQFTGSIKTKDSSHGTFISPFTTKIAKEDDNA